MTRKIKLSAEYRCFPLWDEERFGDFSPDDLPIDDELKRSLMKWSDLWDSSYKDGSPQESTFTTAEEEALFERHFDKEGHRIWNELQKQLGSDYEIAYHSVVNGLLRK